MGKELSLNILEIAKKVKKLEESGGSGGGGEADDVTYDPTASHLEATNVQDAIDELSGEIAGLSADDVSYDGTDSGLSAVTVQSAIDETVNKIENLAADDVSYDNTSSGLTATNVQGAVDEVIASTIPRIASGTTMAQLVSAEAQLTAEQKARCRIEISFTYSAQVSPLVRTLILASPGVYTGMHAGSGSVPYMAYLNVSLPECGYWDFSTSSKTIGTLTAWTLYYNGLPIT